MWEEKLVIYDQLVAMCPKFKRKGKTVPYTSSNGYMFSLLNKDAEIGIRLPPARGKQFMETYESGPFMSHGARMRDYVLIPDSLLKEDMELVASYLNEGYAYVNSLPPK